MVYGCRWIYYCFVGGDSIRLFKWIRFFLYGYCFGLILGRGCGFS